MLCSLSRSSSFFYFLVLCVPDSEEVRFSGAMCSRFSIQMFQIGSKFVYIIISLDVKVNLSKSCFFVGWNKLHRIVPRYVFRASPFLSIAEKVHMLLVF
jgi:hypothetical protein